LEEAKRLAFELELKRGKKPKKELTPDELTLKRQHEIRMRDKGKNRSSSKNQLSFERIFLLLISI